MRPALLLLLTACAPEDVLPVEAGPLAPWLVDDVAELPERTRTLGPTRGSLWPDGQFLDGEPWSLGARDWVVAEVSERIGVIWDGPRVQLGVWLDRHDVDTVAVDTIWTGPDQTGIRIPAGTSLGVEDRLDGRSRVSASNGVVAVDAWLADRDVQPWWIEGTPPDLPPSNGEMLQVLNGSTLLDGPAGEPIGFVEPESTAHVLAVGTHRARGHVRVRFDAGGWPVDAWVHDDDVRPGNFGAWGTGRGWNGSWMCGSGPGPTVRADAWLRAEPDGEVVGRTTFDAWLPLAERDGDWQEVEVDTPFGEARLWVEATDLIREADDDRFVSAWPDDELDPTP